MTIRLATPSDTNAIVSLIRELADTENHTGPIASPEHIEQSFFGPSSPIHIYVMEHENQIVGMAHLMVYPSTFTNKHQAILQDFVIAQSHRGQGLGRKFMQFLSELALEKNYRKIDWLFLKDNEPAAEFYKKIAHISEGVSFCTLTEAHMKQLVAKA